MPSIRKQWPLFRLFHFLMGELLSKLCVKFLSCQENISAHKVDFEFLITPASMRRVQSVASQLCDSCSGTHFIVSCAQWERYSKSISILTVVRFGDLQHSIEVAVHNITSQLASLLISCNGRQALTKIRPLWNCRICTMTKCIYIHGK